MDLEILWHAEIFLQEIFGHNQECISLFLKNSLEGTLLEEIFALFYVAFMYTFSVQFVWEGVYAFIVSSKKIRV